MRTFVAIALVGLLLVPQGLAASGPGPLGTAVDDTIGEVRDDLESANATYGDRQEFRQARFELAQAASALIFNATLVAEEHLVKASGAVATGRLRAQADGSSNPSQQVVESAQQIAAQADGAITRVVSGLRSMERGGLEAVAFDGGLTVAHTVIRAMELRNSHRVGMQQWNDGDRSPEREAQIVTSAIGALRQARIASQVMSDVAELREDAPIEPFVSSEELQRLVDARYNWTLANRSPAVSEASARVDAFYERGHKLLTLGAYLVMFQAQARTGLQLEYEQGKTDAVATAANLYNLSHERINGWIAFLNVSGDIPRGALASGQLVLGIGTNTTREGAARSGAAAAGIFHLAEEHVGLLQEGLANIRHNPGTGLAEPRVYDAESAGISPPLWLGIVAVVALLGAGVWYVRKHT